MIKDESRAEFPIWKVELVTKAFSATEESPVENLLTGASKSKPDLMNEHTDNTNCCHRDIDINDNPVTELCGLKDQDRSPHGFSETVIQPPKTEMPVTSDMVKARTRIVDYEITKDSESDRSSSGNSTPEKRGSLVEGKTVRGATNQAGKFQETIVDIDDSDSSDDSDLLSLALVRNVASNVKSKTDLGDIMDGPRIVQDILNEVVTDAVENHSMYVVEEILETCIERIDFSKDFVEKIDLPLKFGATDIRYRKDAQVVKNNALSVVIISPHTKSLSSFHDAIKNIASRARCESEASSSDVVRMDYVFTLEKSRKDFHDKIKSLIKPPEVYMETKAITEKDLSYRDPPTLTEEQMLHVWHDNKALNMFSGFDIELSVEDEQISFKFESMSALSLFLYCTLGIEKAHLGKVKQAAKVHESLKLKTRFRKKKNVAVFPLQVRYTSRSVDLASLSHQFKFKLFGYRNVKGKPISVTFDFETKKDLYIFLTSPEARAFKEILYN